MGIWEFIYLMSVRQVGRGGRSEVGIFTASIDVKAIRIIMFCLISSDLDSPQFKFIIDCEKVIKCYD